MPGLFISHASEDGDLVLKFVDLLDAGVGVPAEQIFCSSVPGQIPPGRDFKVEIKQRLDQSSLLVPILSEAFNVSRFCMYELGASWGQSKLIMPILVPPTSYQDMAAIIEGTQAVRINDETALSVMRDAILEALGIRGRSTAVWESRRRQFITAVSGLIGRGNNWIYALISMRPEGRHQILGCFTIHRVPSRVNAITATGRAYWVSPKVSIRGEWTTDESLLRDSHLALHYTMKSPPDGEMLNLTKPETHEGIIRLERKNDFTPLMGSACFSGYVHDLFGWKDNTPSMYAERVNMSWEEMIAQIEARGQEVFAMFSQRLGLR
jgi:hypothetical protein